MYNYMWVYVCICDCTLMCEYMDVCMYFCICFDIYICLLIFVCMYVQVPKFHVRAFIFGVFVFIHLCLLYSLTTCIYYVTSQ